MRRWAWSKPWEDQSLEALHPHGDEFTAQESVRHGQGPSPSTVDNRIQFIPRSSGGRAAMLARCELRRVSLFYLSEETYGRSTSEAFASLGWGVGYETRCFICPSPAISPGSRARLVTHCCRLGGISPVCPPSVLCSLLEAECSAGLFQERTLAVPVALCALKGTTWKGVPWEIADSVIACQVLIREGAWLSVP